jgi:hypothetical protein
MQPHRLDVLSLVAGLVFVAIGGGHLLGGASVLNWLVVLRAWPVLLVAAGIAVLVGILRSPGDT